MDNQLVSVILKTGKEQSLKRFHPWVFSGAINKISGSVTEGDVVNVLSEKGDFLGIGHYQPGSIAVRIFSFQDTVPDTDFWRVKIRKALQLRQQLGLYDNPETNVFRLINAEGDGLPGLIVDYYNRVAVTQMHSAGMYYLRNELAAILKELLGDKLEAVYDKSNKSLPFRADIASGDGYILGGSTNDTIFENGLKFYIDREAGQKTGFYIDQRDNRRLLEEYARGRDVLNLFGYTGAFSVYALRGGAQSVHSVDSSVKAIELADKNVNLNFPEAKNHLSFAADAFEYLRNIKDKYDLIILDPPAFAKHRNALTKALQAYKRINTRAFEQIRPGGIVFTFSCSQVVPREKFREAVFSAAAISGRQVHILNQLTHPADHPIDIYHPEGEYLKGLVLLVE